MEFVDISFGISDKNFNVLLNKGNGTFYDPIKYSTEVIDYFLTIGDINNDKKLDIIVGSLVGNTISVHFNNVDGTFTGPITFSIILSQKLAKAVDINDDGKMEIVVIGTIPNPCIDILSIDC